MTSASMPGPSGVDETSLLRDLVRGEPMRPYEELTSADRWNSAARGRAAELRDGIWRWKGRPGVRLCRPVDWEQLCGDDRSQELALHAWEPLAPLLSAHSRLQEVECLDTAVALATDWLSRYPSLDAGPPLAWYDLAVGSRAYRLAYILDAAARDERCSDPLVSQLLAGLKTHAAGLADDARYAGHSNHALYQVMGQLAMARRFQGIAELAAAESQGLARLSRLLDAHFTADGGHLEHSPHYHDLVLIPLRALCHSGLVAGARAAEVCRRSEEGLAWFVSPAGHYAMLGDTPRQTVIARDTSQLESPSLRFALSAGRAGDPPQAVTRGFPESGYVVFRDRWPRGAADFADCSYLAQACGFHSRVHKHADDLSFVWYDRGCDILTDAGRFGYVGRTDPESERFAEGFWYADPARVYVESTHAHNTVEIDGRSYRRRGVRPYGAALSQWGEREGVRFSEAHVLRGALGHTRLLLFLPREWLVVVDSLSDSSGEAHDFSQWFHLTPDAELAFEAFRSDGSISAALPSGELLHAGPLLPQTAIEPVRGATEPRLQGWMSPRDGELEPRWSFGWRENGVRSHTFASLFCFASELRVCPADNEVGEGARVGRLGWTVEGRRHTVSFERVPGRSFELEHTSSRSSPSRLPEARARTGNI